MLRMWLAMRNFQSLKVLRHRTLAHHKGERVNLQRRSPGRCRLHAAQTPVGKVRPRLKLPAGRQDAERRMQRHSCGFPAEDARTKSWGNNEQPNLRDTSSHSNQFVVVKSLEVTRAKIEELSQTDSNPGAWLWGGLFSKGHYWGHWQNL